jgi:hypothetical protein
MSAQEERFDKVKEIVRQDLEGHFRALFTFDPIVVHQAIDELGDGQGERRLHPEVPLETG